MVADWKKAIGPGLLYAGAAVGVSHIVQSTRAGALYGFALLGFVIVVNVLKYPFFEFGSRYTAATSLSLLSGYQKLGKWVLPAFVLLTLFTMFPILAAISAVFVGIISELFQPNYPPLALHALALGSCCLFLVLGRFKLLDTLMRGIMLLLTLTTLVAAIAALSELPLLEKATQANFSWDLPGLLFLIAFAGWMPTPVDSSVWQSLWTLEKRATSGISSWRAVQFDFQLGYGLSTLLAVVFVFIGAVVVYGTSTALPAQAAAFAAGFLNIYVQLLGPWAYVVVAISIFATIFSTLLTVMDGYPRVLQESVRILRGKAESRSLYYWLALGLFLVGTLFLLHFHPNNMLQLVDLATSLSFLTAPILGWWNYRLVNDKNFPSAFQPSAFLKGLSWLGLIFLSLFSLVFLLSKLGVLA